MNDAESGRPSKKVKTVDNEKTADPKRSSKRRKQRTEFKRQQRRAELDHPQPEPTEHRRDRELFGIADDVASSLKPLEDEKKEQLRKNHMPQMFSQPSVIASGDKGIFVTCDKGREKKCLIELADLVEDYLLANELIPPEQSDPHALLQARLQNQQTSRATRTVSGEESPVEEEIGDIESSIKAELSGMRSPHAGEPGSHQAHTSPANVRQFQLITLDIPCVSFLRFIPTMSVYKDVDVVELVYSICAEAARNPGRMRSRYILRLSPVTWLGKILSGGLAQACDEVLPAHFRSKPKDSESSEAAEPDQSDQEPAPGVKFAVKPTIRNNSKISRDDTIKHIATKVQELGGGQHQVDLTKYEKGILLEVYRGWIGISVVDNARPSTAVQGEGEEDANRRLGYEELKRFNLSEIYAEGRNKDSQ